MPPPGIFTPQRIRLVGRVLLGIVVGFPIIWVLFIASGTTFGPAVSDPMDFLITLLNGVTAAAHAWRRAFSGRQSQR